MNRFDGRIGAGVLGGLGTLYLVLSLALHHSARANVPPDLSLRAADAGLDVWRAAALVVRSPDVAIVDVRPAADHRRWHVPGARSEPGAAAARLRQLAASHPVVVVVASSDEVARKLVGAARRSERDGRFFFLPDAGRAWYLAFELPVPMFSETPPPPGYDEALATVRRHLLRPLDATRRAALEALAVLARMDLRPTLLRLKGQSGPAGGGKKKISGGCG